jgi:hypothetical protein
VREIAEHKFSKNYDGVQEDAYREGLIEVRGRVAVGMTGVQMSVMMLVRLRHRPSTEGTLGSPKTSKTHQYHRAPKMPICLFLFRGVFLGTG